MGVTELSNVLWRHRQLLDLLLFRMTVEQTLLVSRQVRWLSFATDEVEAVLEQVRELEVVRSVVVDAVAEELGLAPSPSLRALADAMESPWKEILQEHRRAFIGLTDEIQTVAAANRELLGSEREAAREALDHLTGDSAPPGATPAAAAAWRPPAVR